MPQKMKRIVIVGAGFGGVYAFKRLQRRLGKNPNVELTLVNERNYFLFTPLLHEVATGGISPENIVEPIRKVLGCSPQSFHLGRVESISFEHRTVRTEHETIAYDYLVLAPGATTNFYNISGAEKYSFTLKSLEDAMRLKDHLIACVEYASQTNDKKKRESLLRFAVVGGGPTGVELASEMEEFLRGTFSHYYPKEIINAIELVLIQHASALLPHLSVCMRGKSEEVLRKKNIALLLGAEVTEVGNGYVEIEGGKRIVTDTVVWTAGIKPNIPLLTEDVPRARDGRIIVEPSLSLARYRDVFVIGDAAAVGTRTDGYVPALAQAAVKQAEATAENIARLLHGREVKPFAYRHSGTMVSLGQWMAAGEVGGYVFWGRITWWVWRTVYLFKLVSWQKKLKVALDWTINLFSPRDIAEH
jgi:NADH dehydrogenase